MGLMYLLVVLYQEPMFFDILWDVVAPPILEGKAVGLLLRFVKFG